MAMATSKMVTPAFPAPDKQRCADPDTDEFSCDEMICPEFNMTMGGALRASTRCSWDAFQRRWPLGVHTPRSVAEKAERLPPKRQKVNRAQNSQRQGAQSAKCSRAWVVC